MVKVTSPVVLAALLPLAGHAESASSAGKPEVTLSTGFELDNQDSSRIDLGLSVTSSRSTAFSLAASRTEAESDALAFESTSASGKVEHDFGRFGVAAGVRQVRDQDLTETLGLIGSAFIDTNSARFTATLESRTSDFEEAAFTANAADLGLSGTGTVTGTASCNVDSLGYGLSMRLDRSRWSFYSSAAAFDYSSYGCDGSIVSAGSGSSRVPFSVRRPQLVTRLASAVTSRFAGYSSTRVPSESALLESSVMAGAAFLGHKGILGLELYRDSEQFVEASTTTLLGYMSLPLGRVLGLEVTVGATDSSSDLDSTLFAGLRLSAYLGSQ